MSVSTIRRLETGRSPDLRLRTLHLLAEALELDASERQRLTALLDRSRSEPVDRRDFPAPLVPTDRAPAGPLADEVADAAASLAREVKRRWQREEQQRRVHDPFPLPVRFRPAPADLMDLPENIQRLQPGAAPQELRLSGDLRGVVGTYQGVASQRLVVLGRAGSGKSVLAITFVLDLLAAAATPVRIPMIFGIGSWDPTSTRLRDFLVDRLLQDHPHLAGRLPDGATLAAALVDADVILPVLDGFDELAPGLRGPALAALNETSLPLILTSRRDEYAQAVREVHSPLVWAACVELAELTVDDLDAYLPRTDRRVMSSGGHDDAGVWDAALERLRRQDTQASVRLGRVLSTPLMVMLARTLYSGAPGQDPAELFDTARFPTERHLEEHLLAGFVPTVYRHRAPERLDTARGRREYAPDQALRWLGYLASHLTNGSRERQDLAWWRLGESVRLPTRLLHTALLSALCMSLAALLLEPLGYVFVYSFEFRLAGYLRSVAVVGLSSGVAFSLVHVVVAAFGRSVAVPSQVRLRLSAPHRRTGYRPPREALVHLLAGLLGGAALGSGLAWGDFLVRSANSSSQEPAVSDAIVNMLAYGTVFGLTVGVALGLLAAFEAPMDITAAASPIRLLSVNRAIAIQRLLFLVPAVTLGCSLGGHGIVQLWQQVLHWNPIWQMDAMVVVALIGGLGGATTYLLVFTAWGQWLTLARFWLPLTGKLPWDTAAFLDDAYRRGVLRQTGAVYQFRHIRLQRHLAHAHGRPADRHRPDAP